MKPCAFWGIGSCPGLLSFSPVNTDPKKCIYVEGIEKGVEKTERLPWVWSKPLLGAQKSPLTSWATVQ